MTEMTKAMVCPGLMVSRDDKIGVIKTTYAGTPYVVFNPKGDWDDFRQDDAVKCRLEEITLGWDSAITGKHWHDDYEVLRYVSGHGLCGIVREDDGGATIVRDIEGTDRRNFNYETFGEAVTALCRWSGQRRPSGEVLNEWT